MHASFSVVNQWRCLVLPRATAIDAGVDASTGEWGIEKSNARSASLHWVMASDKFMVGTV